jgi:hypothetical protein
MDDPERKPITVADLRRAIEKLPDDMTVVLEINEPEEDDDLPQAWLRAATVESRCDEVERLYLWGDVPADIDEQEEEEEGEEEDA